MGMEKLFLGRQPILDRRGRIMGYELLFRSEDTAAANIVDERQASFDVIFSTLSTFGIRDLLGRHRGFINVMRDTLMSEIMELLPKERVVIELLESVAVDDEVISRCRDLKTSGFTLALDDHVYDRRWEPLYDVVDIVKLDILAMPAASLRDATGKLRNWPLILLAEKVETNEQYDRCLELGFDLFQGYFFARPIVLAHNRPDISRITLMDLLNQLFADVDIDEIETTFKGHPHLTYNLLRLVNSVAFGVVEKISSLRHALMIVGQQQLKRWTLLAIFACGDSDVVNNPLLELAVTRARLMEQLVLQSKIPRERHFHDLAFITGTLSLVHVLFESPMEEIVNHLNLQEEIRSALMERKGMLGDILLLVERLEQSDQAAITPLLDQLGLSFADLLQAHLESIQWSNNLHLGANS